MSELRVYLFTKQERQQNSTGYYLEVADGSKVSDEESERGDDDGGSER